MANRKTPKPVVKPGKPNGKRASVPGIPPVQPPQAVVELPDTIEDCVTAIKLIGDEMDAIMAKPRRDADALYMLRRKRLMPLIEKVETLLPTPAEGEEAPQESVTDLLTVALHADQGTVPTWSRPGRFLVWFGPIPVLCTWRGMVSTDCYLEPADPRALWIDEDVTIEKSGHVQATDASVDAVFRRWLEAMANSVTPRSRNNKPEHTMKLRHLDRIHEQAVRDHLGRSRWLQEALRRGPVNPVPMPQHLLFAQPALIG